MSNSIFNLYPHNQKALDSIEKHLKEGENRIAILHATGTGKSYITLSLINNHPNKKILVLTRYNSIIEHFHEIIAHNPQIDQKTFLANTTFLTYNSLVNLNKEELANLDIDILVTDEFHHIGAPVWENRIRTIEETHPNLKIIGTSAYSIRNRSTPYERNMAEPNGDEIFSDKVFSYYTLVDAMLDGILPIPRYKTAAIALNSFLDSIEYKVKTHISETTSTYQVYINMINKIRNKLNLSQGMDDLLKRNLHLGDKYIYFCPSNTSANEDNIDKIMSETKDKLLSLDYKEEDIIFYKTTSKDPISGAKNRDAFYHDNDLEGNNASKKLRIMFCINQYNEGVHVPNLTGVILGRGTRSDIVFFEQIGRALSIRGNTKEQIALYEKYTIEELKRICDKEQIPYKDNMSKEDIIERIISPLIIDLAGNFTYIRDLINNLKNEINKRKSNSKTHSMIPTSLTDEIFDIEIIGEDIFNILEGLNKTFSPHTFEEIYKLATNFYKHYGHLNIPRNFKTDDGITYQEFGYSLGEWLSRLRYYKNKGNLEQEYITKLEEIGITWRLTKNFEEAYLLCLEYYNEHHNLDIPYNYKTKDGYNLGSWITNIRRRKKLNELTENQIRRLEKIGMNWSLIQTFTESYNLLKAYYNYYGNIDLPPNFKTNDGINYSEDGFNLTEWLNNQKNSYNKNILRKEKIKLLEDLGIIWPDKEPKQDNLTWDEYYSLAKNYYNTYHNLKVKREFKTKDGVNYDEEGYSLGRWISRQRVNKSKGKLSKEQIELLDKIGMIWSIENLYKTWDEAYQIAFNYYKEYGNLNVPTDYRTEDNYNLSSYLYQNRKKREQGLLTEEQIHKLDLIGMIWNPTNNYDRIKELLHKVGLNPRKYSMQVRSLSFLEFQAKLNFIQENNLPLVEDNKLNKIFNMGIELFEQTYSVKLSSLIEIEKGRTK